MLVSTILNIVMITIVLVLLNLIHNFMIYIIFIVLWNFVFIFILTKNYCLLQIKHYPPTILLNKLIICYIELFPVAVFLQVIYIYTLRKMYPILNITFVVDRKEFIVYIPLYCCRNLLSSFSFNR